MENKTSAQASQILYTTYEMSSFGKLQRREKRRYEERAAFAEDSRDIQTLQLISGCNPELLNEDLFINLARLYADTFSVAPWNEVGRCFDCGNFYPEKGITCPNEGSIVREAYPVAWTVDYIQRELTKPESFFVITNLPGSETLMSFAWGYKTTINEFAKTKYTQSEEAQDVFSTLVCQQLFLDPSAPIFYISEIGTSPECRGKGLATESCRLLLEAGSSLQLPILTRTLVNPPSIYGIAQKLKMIQVSGPVRETSISIDPIDPIDERRVLFVKDT